MTSEPLGVDQPAAADETEFDVAGARRRSHEAGSMTASAHGSPKEALARLAERYRLTKATLRLIAQADNPALSDTDVPDDRQVEKVIDAIEVLVLAGLDSDRLIAYAITEQRERGGEQWRDELWRGLLAAAGAEWERRGRPEHPLEPHLTTVGPIPPQPAEQIDDDRHRQAA
jgi:hypothetical protein